MTLPKRGQRYKHFRSGDIYEVHCVVDLEADDGDTKLVVYFDIQDSMQVDQRRYWARPLTEWSELVNPEPQPRFARVEQQLDGDWRHVRE